jgi:8-amino-3,8-dideoxy-alpha-D-manno-octulosonate transaminase
MPGFELINKKNELKQITNIFNNGCVLYRYGFEKKRNNIFKVKEFEDKFAKKFNSKYALGVTSGTAAIRVALSVLNLKRGDEIITQSFTFVATVEAIVESGAIPVCTEIDNTLNMNPSDLERKITKKTKAVILVHMLGYPGYVDKIKKICLKKKIPLIEDTAWGIGAKYNNLFLGTHGRMGTFSFDYAKTITTGEGGMILFKNKKDYLKAKAWHDHGHENNPKFERWEDTRTSSGFNFRMNEVQAAIGIAQLKKIDIILKLHRKNALRIWRKIKHHGLIQQREIPNKAIPSCESFTVIFPSKKLALKCRDILNKNKIFTKILPEALTWHFCPKWTHIKQLKQNTQKSFKKSSEILSRCVSLPIFCKMNQNLIDKISLSIRKTLS